MAGPRREGGEARPPRHSADAGSPPPPGTGPDRPAPHGTRAPRPRRGRRGTRVGRFFKNLAFTTLVLVLVLAIAAGVGAIVFYNRTNLPDPNKDFQTNTSFIYFNDSKTKLGSLSVQNRQTIDYEQMPEAIKEATVSAENRSFWQDQGISVGGIARAAWTIARGGEMQGGSTITQQYIKILYLSQDRTMQRKLKELVLAVKMGKQVPKEDILAGYLNTIYFGRGAYGIQAAAKSYFNVDASKLTVPQSAVLASILNNPALFDPSAGAKARERLLNRYRYVLDGMLEAGNISQSQHDEYSRELPTFPDVPINNRWGGTNGYLLKMVEDELRNRGFADSQINGGGLKVTTTFDSAAQKAAVATGQKYKKRAGANAGKNGAKNLHPAIASVKVGTGEVLALYGGDDYLKSSRSWALQARPAASTFKTYSVIAGMRNGFSLRSKLNGDTFTPNGDSVPIRNEFSEQYGDVTLQKATEDSINTAFVDMMTQMKHGPSAMVKAADDAGVSKGSGWDLNNRMPLGVAEVSPLDQATGYATIANEGRYVPRHVISRVTDAKGRTLYQADTTGEQKIEKDIAHDTSYALENVVNEGTGSAVSKLGYPVAGKTGTNGVGDDITSAWFVAYTKQISTAVMYVAGDGGNSDLDPYAEEGDSTFFGGTYPAQTWADYMQVAMKGQPAKDFPKPDRVNLSGKHYGDTRRETLKSPTPTPTPSRTRTPSQEPTRTPSEPEPTETSSEPEPTPEPSEPEATQTPSLPEPTRTPSRPVPSMPKPTLPGIPRPTDGDWGASAR